MSAKSINDHPLLQNHLCASADERIAYLNVNLRYFDSRTKQVNELVDTGELPHISQLLRKCDILWCCRWFRLDHLAMRPLSRHPDEGEPQGFVVSENSGVDPCVRLCREITSCIWIW